MKYDHDVIRDLMPLCIDGIASEKSQKAVDEHLAECPDCKKEWEQMKNNIQPCENIPLPEDTEKYKETAKRVRKHHRWMLLKVTCTVIAVIFIGGIVVNFIDGARFTPEAAAKTQMKEISGYLYETPEEWHNAPKAEIIIIGTIKSEDKKAANTYALIHHPDLNVVQFSGCFSDRSDLLRMGMWIAGSSCWSIYDDNTPILMTCGISSYDNCSKYFGNVAFFVADDRIKKISFVKSGKNYTISPNKSGFCGVIYETNEQKYNQSISEGTATDGTGKVLYQIQEITKKLDNGSDYTYFDWVKAE